MRHGATRSDAGRRGATAQDRVEVAGGALVADARQARRHRPRNARRRDVLRCGAADDAISDDAQEMRRAWSNKREIPRLSTSCCGASVWSMHGVTDDAGQV